MYTQAPIPIFQDKPLTSIIIQETPWQTSSKKPEPKPDYIIKEGDNLTSISKALNVPLDRLWAKNTQLANPDVLAVAEPLKIPLESDVLPERPFPATISTALEATTGTAVTGGSSSSGNSYSVGYCTWYVKNLRPELPNNLGHANTWFSNAKNNGLAVGYTPRVGAVAVAIGYTHVALVTAVHGDTVTISEMNYKGWNVVSERVAPASEFNYIY